MSALFFLLAAACGQPETPPLPPPPAPSPEEARRAITTVLDDWHDAAADADEDRYFSHFTPDGIFLGTDATERWDTPAFRAYAHPHFARRRAWTFRAARRAIILGSAGDVAWFDEDLTTENLGPARGSGVLLRGTDGTWRIAHYNLALTIPNDRFAEVHALLTSAPPVTEH